MKIKESIGIDVSKLKIHAWIYSSKNYKSFSNKVSGYRSLLKWVLCKTNLSYNEFVFCCEHTGLYSVQLASFFSVNKINFSMVASLEIKRSLGITRGKNDKVDAKAIAEYAYLRREHLMQYKLPSKNIWQLKNLITLRERMVTHRQGYMASLKEFKCFIKRKDNVLLFNTHDKMIKQLTKQIKATEHQIKDIIKEDSALDRLYKLITSVKGIGFVLAINFIVLTNCFTLFDSWRKFACYSGIAPFEKQSGTSIKTRSKVHPFANKKMKSLLNMAAFVVIQCDGELKNYYLQRIDKGKSKMSTINIIRNKLVARVFAVVNRGTPFVSEYKKVA